MAFAQVAAVTYDSDQDVVYERDDTNDGGAGTTGRHRITVNGVAGTVYPAGRTAHWEVGNFRFAALSYDPLDNLSKPGETAPVVFRVIRIYPA